MKRTDHQQDYLTRVLPILRGCLANPSGDPDRPYCPVILSLSPRQGKRRTGRGSSAQAPSLAVRLPSTAQSPEKLRERLEKAIAPYRNRHDGSPKAIDLGDLGVVEVTQSTTKPARTLENKVALVTGAAGAIGYGVCETLLEQGCHVAATDLPGPRLKEFVAHLKAAGQRRVFGAGMDVTKPASVATAFDKVIRKWGGIDIVVLNAGIALVSRLQQIDPEAFRRLEKVNVEGALLTLQAAAAHMRAQDTGGDVVVMSTKNVPCPGAGFGAYSATKAACHQLGRIASLELAEYGIRVNMVAPDAVFAEGPYKSGLWQEVGPDRMRARGLDEKGLQQYYQNRNLLKAPVTGRHVGNAVLFFVTRQTPTTGATIPVDGGLPDATPR